LTQLGECESQVPVAGHAPANRHNSGATGHTTEHRLWSLLVVLEFSTEQSARRFERYLKSGSGRAFAKRYLDSSSSGTAAQ